MDHCSAPELSPQTLLSLYSQFSSLIFLIISQIISPLKTPRKTSPSLTSLKVSSLSYLIGFSNLASPKSHSYPSFQICFWARLLRISNWQLHTSICLSPNLWSQSLSFSHSLLSIYHRILLNLPLKHIYDPNIMNSIHFYQFSPTNHFLNEKL